MNRFVLLTTSLLILIIGIGCASAADLYADDSLGSALGGGGDNGPFYAVADLEQASNDEALETPSIIQDAQDVDQADALGYNRRAQLGAVAVADDDHSGALGDRRGPRGMQESDLDLNSSMKKVTMPPINPKPKPTDPELQ